MDKSKEYVFLWSVAIHELIVKVILVIPFFIQRYMVYIKRLPINDTPEIFSLHENANITFAQNETFSLLNGILLLQPKSAVGAGRSREEVG